MSENNRILWNARMRGRARAGMRRRSARLLGARRLRRRRYNYPSIKAEPKHYETFLPATAVATNATFAGLLQNPSATSMITTPTVGDSYNNRDGKKIIVTQLEIKGQLYHASNINQTTAPFGSRAWVAVILDTQCNGVVPTTSDIFNQLDTTPPTAYWSFPYKNLLLGGRFRILKFKYCREKNTNFNYDGTNFEVAGSTHPFKVFKKMRLPVDFNAGTTADIANVTNNCIHVLAWADDNRWQIGYVARIRFIG